VGQNEVMETSESDCEVWNQPLSEEKLGLENKMGEKKKVIHEKELTT